MADDVRARDLDATTAKGTAHGIVISKGFPLPRALVSPVTDMTANGAFVRTYIYIYICFICVRLGYTCFLSRRTKWIVFLKAPFVYRNLGGEEPFLKHSLYTGTQQKYQQG
jgi:hypothetical protein